MKAHESTRKRLERSLQKGHEDRIAGKEFQFIESLKSCPQVHLHASSNDNRCQSRCGPRTGKPRKIASMASDQSEDQKRGIKETLMGICHLQCLEQEPKFQKYKGRVALRGDIVKYDSGSYAELGGKEVSN